ncbi:MAG: glycosyltransferase family 39 protein [Proteobacteria bacterium]|nr:glycosyltransferase family 39 protein [Pseudomonadota bacterium]
MSEGGLTSQELRRRTPAALLGLLAIAAYGAIAIFTLFNAQTFTAEVSALVRGWWYATGAVTPYSPIDTPAEMPLYFYELGYWQQIAGPGHLPGRILSVILGAVSGLLLFSICRTLTANTAVAAAAAFIFLATPSTSFFFATATPAATVAVLLLAAVWIAVHSVGRPRAVFSVLMGFVCAALYFTRQDTVFAVIVVIPLYIAAVGRDRALHGVILLSAFAAVTTLMILLLPAKFHALALNLPVLGPMLGDAGMLGADYTLVTRGTHGAPGLGAALEMENLRGLLESFVLPHAGTILLALLLFAAARGPLRVLWIAPLTFLWLAVTQYASLSAAGACDTCMHPATPTFAALGALAAALTLATSARWMKRHGLSPGATVTIGAIAAVVINTFAPSLASHPQANSFPRPMLDGLTAAPELAEIPALTRWAAAQLKTKQPVLVIHGLGHNDVPALPYAVVAAGHAMPAESLDLIATERTINESLVGEMRESVRAAVEADGLWSEETMQRWIEKDYNVILLQDDAGTAALKKEIEARFDPAGATRYRGRNILLFTRKLAQ